MEQTNENARSQTPQFTKWKIIKNINVLSLAFLLLYTAYNGLTMLQSTMNKAQGVGTAGQASLFVSYGLSSLLFSSYSIKKLGIKMAQILGMLLYLPYIAANFYPSWLTIIPSGILIGIGSTLNWGAQCTYFNECSIMFNRLVNETSAHTDACDTSSKCKSNVHPSEELAPPSLFYKGQAKVSLNKAGKELNIYTVPVKTSSDNRIISRTSKILGENKTQPSETGMEETSSIQAVRKLFSSVEDQTRSSAGLKGNCDISCRSVPEKDIQKTKSQKPVTSLSSTNAVFFGLHGLAYCSAQIWSNLLCFYVLRSSVASNFNKTLNCFCGAEFCNTDEECVSERIEDVPTETRDLLTGLCVACGATGALLVWILLDPINRTSEKVSFSWDNFFDTIKFVKKKEQLFVIPLSILVGMIQAFYTADITKAYIACAWTISQVGIVTVFYGIASSASAIFSGVLIKYFGRKPVLILCQILNVANLCFLLLWKPDVQSAYEFYIEGAVFGFVAGILHSQIKALYGVFFEGDEETAFSSCSLYSSIGWSLPFIYSDLICTSAKIYMMLTLSCLAIIGYVFSERSFNLRNNQFKTTNSR